MLMNFFRMIYWWSLQIRLHDMIASGNSEKRFDVAAKEARMRARLTKL